MFATLLGALPRPPLPESATPAEILDAIVSAQAERGFEPLTDGGWPTDRDDPIAAFRSIMARTDRIAKAVIAGPYGANVERGGSVERWRAAIAGLADAGCRWVEVAEPEAARIGDDGDERDRFRDLHDRLLAGLDGVPDLHLSLAITGGSADGAGAATILEPPYASLAVDLIAGPDNWRLVRATPGDRGIVCGALSPRDGSDDGPELLLWAAGYAASSAGRGPSRVGLATASSLAALPWAVAERKLDRLADAARIAVLPREERLRAIDPRAIDARSAALGRYEPRPDRSPNRPSTPVSDDPTDGPG